MALITVSGSMPFSFARASIVCCSGFDIFPYLKLHLEIRPRNRVHRNAVALVILAVDNHVPIVDAAERTAQERLPVDRLTSDHLRQASGKTPVIVRRSQRSVESGGRHFQDIRRGNDLFHVEDRAHLAADVGAVLNADALFRSGQGARSIDLNAEDHSTGLAAELDVEDLDAVPGRHAAGYRSHPFDHRSEEHTSEL